jgi:hypothetical protein
MDTYSGGFHIFYKLFWDARNQSPPLCIIIIIIIVIIIIIIIIIT